MPALTFDHLPDETPTTVGSAGGRLPRVYIHGSHAPQEVQSENSGGALTFDHLPDEEGAAGRFGRYAMDIGRSALSGLDKGVAGLAGLPAWAILGLQDAANYATAKVQGRTFEDVSAEGERNSLIPRSFLEQYTPQAFHDASPLAYKPQTTAGEYAHTIGEFAPAALLPGSAMARAGQVLAPGILSETAGQVTEGTAAEPWARFGGALVGGIGASLASRPSTAARAVQEQMPKGITPQMVDQAESLMAQARQQGIDLAWPEALSQVAQRPVLTNTMRSLEAAPQTEAQMAEFFARRPQQVEHAARSQFDSLAPVNTAPSSIGPAVGRAAGEEIDATRQAINAASEPFYSAAERTIIPAADMARVRAVPGYAIAAKAIRSDPQLRRYVDGLPENSVGFVGEVKKWLDTAAENAAGPMNAQRNMQRSAGFGKDATVMRDAAVRASSDYEIALAIQKEGREKFLQPLLDGYMGKLASKDVTTQNAINALFPKNPLPNSQIEIADAVGRLAGRNQRAARDLVRAHVESVFNNSARDLQTGANQAGGAKFRTALVGNSQQEANLKAAVEALPQGKESWQGFEKFLDVLEATGTRQNVGSRTAYNQEFLREASKGGVAGDLVKTGANPTRFLQPLTDRYERYRLGKNLDQLAAILTDPNAGKLLRVLAKEPVKSARAQAIAVRLATYRNAAGSEKKN